MKSKVYKPEQPVSKPLNNTSGSNAAECPTCHEVFTSVSYFDKHLKRVTCKEDTYKMVCQDPKDVGLSIGSRGYWTIPSDNKWWEKSEE